MRKKTGTAVKIIIAAVFFIMAVSATAFGAARKPITSVSLSIDARIIPDTDIGAEEIQIETRSDKYSVDGYMVLNSGSFWESKMDPEIQVTLTAGENFYFKSIPKSKIKLRGDGEITKGAIKDSSSTLVLNVKFPSLKTVVPDIQEVELSEEGIATWKPVLNAGKYELIFKKNGSASVTPVITERNSFNCRERMGKKGGTYSLKVRAVNQYDESKKGKWTESNTIYVEPEKAAQFREDPEGNTGKWMQTEDGRYWYQRADGTYPADTWEKVAECWYFFDETGYMKTGWIQWNGSSYYCSERGDMLMDTNTPDGQRVGPDGAKVENNQNVEGQENSDDVMEKEWDRLQGNDTEED